ncbi:NUDIX hydrolase [Aestuariibacter sp. A3R04]|uniref:NUDIX hydrolase n=1 Tax=Aestuariibacter sp. A3R04 TaxID=2841571 RepID=UPI001C0855C3|nr:NUDIX hydrolase [Aestuariibacter sp. A3R04]MBU3020724.1 NUDIX hydrolase [Aestuariibacter sp. A3R04]
MSTPCHPNRTQRLPHLSVDNIVFGIIDGKLNVLIAEYNEGDAKGKKGLLGGWIGIEEDIDDAAKRLVSAITGEQDFHMEQLRAFGAPDRFHLDRVITIAYYTLVRPENYSFHAGFTADDVRWYPADGLPTLIYDHNQLVDAALEQLKRKIRFEPIGFNLLPEKFTLRQLLEVYEAILGIKLDKPNFRRKILKMNLLVDCKEKQKGVTHRAANYYRFDPVVYEKLCEHGFNFEF